MVSDQRTYMQYNVIDVGKTWKRKNILFLLKENSTKDCTTNSLSNDGITTCSLTKTLYDNKIQYQIKS